MPQANVPVRIVSGEVDLAIDTGAVTSANPLPIVISESASPASILSGQKTVTTAGTAVVLGNQVIQSPIIIKALDTNTDIVALGNDGADDVTTGNGLRLEPGESVVLEYLENLNSLYLDSAVNGEGVSWMVLRA